MGVRYRNDPIDILVLNEEHPPWLASYALNFLTSLVLQLSYMIPEIRLDSGARPSWGDTDFFIQV